MSPDDGPVELAALADGSLDLERQRELEARVAASPRLAALLDEQERAVALVRDASADVAAPAALRMRIAPGRSPRRRRSYALATGLAAVAAAALAVFLVVPGGAGGPTAAAAAALADRGATAAAPRAVPAQPKLLARAVAGVAFPNWDRTFGWRAAGLRMDTLAGRDSTTVFYTKNGARLGYSIVDGSALRHPRGAVELHRNGTELYAFTADGRTVVAWLRGGRTCVLSGRRVGRATLLKLASWKGRGAVPF